MRGALPFGKQDRPPRGDDIWKPSELGTCMISFASLPEMAQPNRDPKETGWRPPGTG